MKNKAAIGKWKARAMAEKRPTHEFFNENSRLGRLENERANTLNVCDLTRNHAYPNYLKKTLWAH